MTAVRCVDLCKTYRQGEVDIKALDHVSIEIKEGGFVCLSAPSGGGKTTLLNAIGGLDTPDSGEIRLAGERIEDHREAKRTARRIIKLIMAEFREEFGSHNCGDLIDYEISIPSEHDAFIESGVWRDTCMKQIEFSVARLHALADPDVWDEVVGSLDADG